MRSAPVILPLALVACLAAGLAKARAQDPEPAPPPVVADTDPSPAPLPPEAAEPEPEDEPAPEPESAPEAGPDESEEGEPSPSGETAPSPVPERGREELPDRRRGDRVGTDEPREILPREERDERRERRDRRGARPTETVSPDAKGSAPTDAPFDPSDFRTFRMIAERNIFDPKRTRRSAVDGPRPPSRPDPVVETLGVVGILEGAQGTVAFFDGSGPGFRKSVRPEGTIAGLRVAGIVGDTVRLADGDRQFEVPVGSHLRREDGGEWEVRSGFAAAGRPGPGSRFGSARSEDPSTPSAASGATGTDSGGDGGPSDALKRLLQKRQQEINR